MKRRKHIRLLLIISSIIIILFITLSLFGKELICHFFYPETAISPATSDRITDGITFKKGDYILLGSYLDEPVLWQVIDVDGTPRALINTEYAISFKAFDANGANCKNHSGTDMKKFGSSVWESSSLRTWLNSTENTVKYDGCIPDKSSVSGGYNAYSSERGFLCDKNFADYEIKLFDSEVFILSESEVESYYNKSERAKFATKSAAMHDKTPFIILPGKKVWYWIGSPDSSNRVSVRAVTSSGGVYRSLAFDSAMGVVPAAYIKNESHCCLGDGSKSNPFRIVN